MEVAVTGALLLLWVLFFFIFSSLKMYKKKSQLPPGPTPWFLLGNLLQKDVLPVSKNVSKLMDKWGPIFTVWMGPKPMVVLCGYEVVKDALLDHAEEFGGRPTLPFFQTVNNGCKGLSCSTEKKWRELRRFTLTTLRDFGMGKKTMSKRVQEEALCLVEAMATTKGQLFDVRKYIRIAVSNVLCSVVFGSRFDYKDQVLLEKLRIMESFVSYLVSYTGQIYNVFPKIMPYLPGQHKKILGDFETLHAYINKSVESHRETLDYQDPRDYIDCFLMKSEKEQTNHEAIYSQEELIICVQELFIAGSLSTSEFLTHALLVMARLPHIQEKVQREIDEVVGANRIPGMEDRVGMPYTNAVLHEIQRYDKGSIESFPRETTCPTKFRGYLIPQGTTICSDMASVHFDPLQWENPEEFNPGHFLDEKGQFRNRVAFMPFSAGKRACPGEALARMELFLFFGALLQNFTFQLIGDAKDKDIFTLYEDSGLKPGDLPLKFIRRSI
ncbi:cytochrome P450 2C55-like [Zootoca vivipara]|uniref:cytochrome P450 2C55-like n=1 Tax=Zootoca vivipara TaxID=8524 RepID=UPI00293BAB78|nr:cytochrome P450 2C55-like [Zootoca vivipara]XP_060127785.1 cytochrome P450 2C55-like [Zootoca vivipara]